MPALPPLDIELLWQLQRVGAPALAPDGRAAVVPVTRHSMEDNRGRTQLWWLPTEGQGARPLTWCGAGDSQPVWSPRGDLIAFVSTNSGNDEIYTITLDGTITKQLTVNQFEWDKHPSWSPDGSQLVFFSNRETGRRQLWVMNADGSGQRNLSSNEYEDWDPIWIR